VLLEVDDSPAAGVELFCKRGCLTWRYYSGGGSGPRSGLRGNGVAVGAGAAGCEGAGCAGSSVGTGVSGCGVAVGVAAPGRTTGVVS